MMKKLTIFLLALSLLIACDDDTTINFPELELVSPVNNNENESLSALLQWEQRKSSDYGFKYSVYLGTTSEDLQCIIKDTNITSFRSGALNLNTKYYWKVVAKSGSSVIAESEVFNFVTIDTLPWVLFNDEKLYFYPAEYTYENPNIESTVLNNSLSTEKDIDYGYLNTQQLFAEYNKYPEQGLFIAAKYCYELNAYGYDDWYLPSVNEMLAIKNQQSGMLYNEYYWTSTEVVILKAYSVNAINKYEPIAFKYKKEKLCFRPVRRE